MSSVSGESEIEEEEVRLSAVANVMLVANGADVLVVIAMLFLDLLLLLLLFKIVGLPKLWPYKQTFAATGNTRTAAALIPMACRWLDANEHRQQRRPAGRPDGQPYK